MVATAAFSLAAMADCLKKGRDSPTSSEIQDKFHQGEATLAAPALGPSPAAQALCAAASNGEA